MYIDPDDEDAVVWLQRALTRVRGHSFISHVGKLDFLTKKALLAFQKKQSLPITGEADEATLQKIQQELDRLDGA